MAQYLRQTFTVGSAGISWPLDGTKLMNVSYKETAGVACTITLTGPDGDSVDNLAASAPGLVYKKVLMQIRISGNGAVVVVDARGPDEYIDPRYLASVAISGTVTTDIGVAGTYAKDATVSTTNSLLKAQPYANNAAAPFDGSAFAAIDGTGAEPLLNGQKVGIGTLASGSRSFQRFPITNGATYNWTACTFVSMTAFPSGG